METENQKCVAVVFSDRAYKDIQTETYDKDPVETGGILFGHRLTTGHWVVVEVIPPGDNSTHQYAYFEYDQHFVNRVASQIADKYEQKLELLGLWHRHPGSMDFFSGTDDGTNRTFAELNPSFGAISGLVNIDPEFRMTMYHVDSPLNYTKVETFIGDDIIPEDLLKLKPGVTFEEIDAIKKQKMHREQPSASQPSSPSQPQQATPHREEPRQTTQNREHHEKPQVVIQSPDTVTSIFKKLVLEHTKAVLIASIVIVLSIAVVLVNSSSQKTKQTKEQIAAAERAEQEQKEAEAKQKQEAEASKINSMYSAYLEAKNNSTAKKLEENHLKNFKTFTVNYPKNQTKIDNIITEIENQIEVVQEKEKMQQKAAEDKKAFAKEQRDAQNEYNSKIRRWYDDKYLKELDNISLKTVNECLNKLEPLQTKGLIKHPQNKETLKNIIEAIKDKKIELEQRQRQQENAKQEKEKDIKNEYNNAINIPCKKTIEALEQCIEKLKGLKLVYHENDKPRNDKVQELETQKQELLKNKQEDEDKTLLENNEAYKYFKQQKIDPKKHAEHLKSLESNKGKLQSPKYKKEVEDLIKGNNPKELSDILNNDKIQCEAKCAAYKKLKSINRDNDKKVLEKFEKETCKEGCK